MNLAKKKIIFIVILVPSLLFNYVTLSFLDYNNSLSQFSTIFISITNLINLIFAYIYYIKGFKFFVIFFSYCFLILIFFDFTFEKFFNFKSINKHDDELGWILRADKDVEFLKKTKQGTTYNVNFKTSKIEGFREYGNIKNNKQKIIVIGDSHTGGPFTSNNKVYYNVLKKILDEKNINLEWFVMGASGYGTVQQFLLLKRHYQKIKPDIILYQFCANDFWNNSYQISKFASSHDQFYRRPYFEENKFFKSSDFFSKIYRFFYKNSFIFKKLDQIYIYRKFRLYGYYKEDISEKNLENSIINTQELFYKIRKMVGLDTLFFSITCPSENDHLKDEWKKMIINIEGYPLQSPYDEILKSKYKNMDIFVEGGGHLNPLGNEIYGKTIAKEILKILN